MKINPLVLFSMACVVEGFAPSRQDPVFSPSTRSHQKNNICKRQVVYSKTELNETPRNIKDSFPSFGLGSGENPLSQFTSRFLEAGGGEVGSRGEVYFFAQALLIVGVAFGGIPFVSSLLRAVAGPGMMLLGGGVIVATALDLGDALSPWPKPNGEGLTTSGLYSQVRHPMYAGVLALLTGYSVWTTSVDRLLLVGVLLAVLEVKASYEEVELAKAYPDYPAYQEEVRSKFIPQSLLNIINMS